MSEEDHPTSAAKRAPTEEKPHRSRLFKWTKRIVLGLLGTVVFVVGAVVIFIHTDYGRDTVKNKVVDQLQNTFVGGIAIGKLEGSPFGELVLRDVVINGPDHEPAITVGTLRTRVRVFELLRKQIQLQELVLEDLDVAVKRDKDGVFEITQLTKPGEPKDPDAPESKSSWNIELPAVAIKRGHLMVDTGQPDAGVVDLDNLEITANAHLPADGAKAAGINISAMWRQRQIPLSISVQAKDDGSTASVSALKVLAGKVSVIGKDLSVERRGERAPMIAGLVQIVASSVDVAKIVPRIDLPADIAVAIDARHDKLQTVTVAGTVGMTPLYLEATGDLDTKKLTGKLATGMLDIATISRGKVDAMGGLSGTFELAMTAPGDLPDGNVRLDGHGTFQGLPSSQFAIAVDSHGNHVSTSIDVSGAAKAKITAEIRKAADAISLENAAVVVSTTDPEKASGGKAPVEGSLEISLTAKGQLTPKPNLSVAGTIQGRKLSMKAQQLSIAKIDLRVDAKQLPEAPLGTLNLKALDIVRGEMQLGALAVDAKNRSDGKIAVEVSSHPKQNPWLVDLSALVTPPAKGGGDLVVELTKHRVRAGNGVDWTGHTGKVTVGSELIEVTNLVTASAEGKVAVQGSFYKAGKRAGDLTAKVDVDRFTLDALSKSFTGLVAAHVTAARTSGKLSADVDLKADKLALQANAATLDIGVKVSARPSKVTASVTAAGGELGSAKVAVDVAAPAKLEDVAAWKAKGKDALKTARLELTKINLQRVAEALAPNLKIEGVVNGQIDVGATTKGHVEIRGVKAPQMRGIRFADADFDLAQTKPDEISPKLTVRLADIGTVVAEGHVGTPERVFDVAAWKKMGTGAIHGATVQTDTVNIDPAMLARLGVTSTMRGKASFKLEIAPDLKSVQLAAVASDLRGTPIAKPVSINIGAVIDSKQATASMAMTQQGKPLTLIKLDGKVPVSIEQLRAPGFDAKALPVDVSLVLPKTSAPQLLEVLGRSDLVSGSLDGKIDVTGTIGKPQVKAHIVGDNLGAKPSVGTKIHVLKNVVIDATYDGTAKLTIDGNEDAGGKLHLEAQANPQELATATAKITAKNFDMAPLLAFAPGPAGGSRGSLDANLEVKGFDIKTAKIRGDLHLHNARLPLAPAVGTLRQSNINVNIDDKSIKLDADGKVGAGEIKMNGSIALEGTQLSGGEAKIKLHRVSPIGAIEPQIDADITAKISRSNETWTIDTVIDNGFVKVTKSSGEKLKPVGNPSDLVVGTADAVAKAKAKDKAGSGVGTGKAPENPTIKMIITLHPVAVESEEARTTLHGKLDIAVDGEDIGINGSIEATSGDLDLFDRRYRIEQAGVVFDGSVDPRLEVRITHDFTDVTTVTEVRGRASKPQLVLSANPGTYSQAELLGFLLGGEPGGDPQSGSAKDKATSAGTSFIANQIGGYVKKALPVAIDVIKYEAASVGSSAAITVGSWITHTLFFAYRQHLDARADENTGEGTLEYWLTRRLELEGTIGDRNYDGLDVLWRKRF